MFTGSMLMSGRGSVVTWNPADKHANIALSNGNLTATDTSLGWKSARATLGKAGGKWYWEGTINASQQDWYMFGVGSSTFSLSTYVGGTSDSWSFYGGNGGRKVHTATETTYGSNTTNGDIVSVLLNMDAGEITFWKNGVTMGLAFSGLSGTLYPAVAVYGGGSAVTANFGMADFAYTPPAGYLAL